MAVPSLSPPPDSPAILIDVDQVASLLGVSARTVYRMADSGAMPRPRRLNSLVRWSRSEIESWVAGGCRSCRTSSNGRRTP